MTTEVSTRIPEDWITPQEQLESLIQPEEIVVKEVFDAALPVWDLASIVAKYAHNLSSHLSKWHTALYEFNLITDTNKIPPIPFKIKELLESRFLYLCPPLSTYQITMHTKIYGKNHSADYEGVNVFGLDGYITALFEHLHTGSDEWQWLSVQDTEELENCSSSEDQLTDPLQTVAELNTGEFVNYKIPSMVQMVAFGMFHKVTSQNSNNRQPLFSHPYTLIKETTQGNALVIWFSADGLMITRCDESPLNYVVATV